MTHLNFHLKSKLNKWSGSDRKALNHWRYTAAVKYQRCGMAIPIVGNYLGPHNDRVAKKDKWMENYYHGANINYVELKAELAGLLEEDAKKADILGRLALYSCRLLAGNSHVYSKCYDKVYRILSQAKINPETVHVSIAFPGSIRSTGMIIAC